MRHNSIKFTAQYDNGVEFNTDVSNATYRILFKARAFITLNKHLPFQHPEIFPRQGKRMCFKCNLYTIQKESINIVSA